MGKYALILATLGFNVTGGYFAKLSAMSPDSPLLRYMILSIGFYGCGFLFYIFALKRIPLFVAQSMLSSQYMMMVLLSFIVFHEPISSLQWVGMGLIFLGIFFVIAH